MTDKAREKAREKDPRSQQIAERKKRMKELNPPPERVRVTPKDDDMRRVLKHPSAQKFPASGSMEWPLDQFTRRRIKDGSVTEDKAKQKKPAESSSQPQSQPAPTPEQPPKPAA